MSSVINLINFNNTFVKLGGKFYSKVNPTPVKNPCIRKINYDLADELGIYLNAEHIKSLSKFFSGNQIISSSEPLAMVYAGHQFGHFVPQLGDGRAILLGEVLDTSNNRRDIQLKGSGITPFSRQGDGRSALGPVLREYIISEAMNALGIPTTRSLSVLTTGEPVFREKILPGAILTRVAFGHIRAGTFQYFAFNNDYKALSNLSNYVIDRHYPELKERKKPYLKLLEGVMEKYAKLIAKWMSVGFIHGVMNTDNMSITCETIDYGPCAFIDKYNNNKVFSSIDHFGRYSYGNQPIVAKWNLARFAETILPLIDTLPEKAVELANDVIEKFTFKYKHYWLDGMRRKIGLYKKESGDEELIQSLLNMMQENQTDFTLTFRKLCDASSNSKSIVPVRNLFKKKDQFDNWVKKWRKRLILEEKAPNEIVNLMCNSNPAVIPRNHRIEQVIQAAEEYEDFTPFEKLLDALLKPYEELENYSEYTLPPKTDEEVLKTFCGT